MLDTVVKNLPFKVTDRTFVAVTSYTPMMFIVHSDSPFKTLKDAGEALKKDAETFTWTSLGGVGAQDMVFRRFAAHLGVDIKRPRAIALKGGAGGGDHDGRRPCHAGHRHLQLHRRPSQRQQDSRAGRGRP